MKRAGIGGALLWDGGSGGTAYGSKMAPLPAGPAVMSPEWREMVRHAVAEADRLGIELSLNMGTGPNCGGPWIPLEHAAKTLAWSEVSLVGPRQYAAELPSGAAANTPRWAIVPELERTAARWGRQPAPYYREIAVLAGGPGNRWIDISSHMDASGKLTWDVPAGTWTVLRFGYIATPQKLSYSNPGLNRDHGWFVDHFSAEAVDFQVSHFVEPLVRDAGVHAGRGLKYFHCDSWEIDSANWTPKLLDEFRRRRGYDPLLYLPALAGKTVLTADTSERFRQDVRRTLADCLNDYHFARLVEATHRLGVGFHSESGGPHPHPVDPLAALGRNDFPMGEFWVKAATHRVTEDARLFIKQAASAAHLYGQRFVAMESFTSMGPQWEEDPRILKPVADRAFVEGGNRFFIHNFSHSPASVGKPGNVYMAGTHFEPGISWWNQARAWTDYLARCQYLLTEGRFSADVLYFTPEQIPNFVPRKKVQPGLGFGYDYDAINSEVLLTRISVKDGRLTLPNGAGYRLLVLPQLDSISLDVLEKIASLVRAGATLMGPPPQKSIGVQGSDLAVRKLTAELWGDSPATRRVGQGRVIWNKTPREILLADGVHPDFAMTGAADGSEIDFIHREADGADVYFVANQVDRPENLQVTFRVSGKSPELWDPATGRHAPQIAFEEGAAGTSFPLRLPAYGSVFVVFRGPVPMGHNVYASPELDLRQGARGVEALAWQPGKYQVRRAGTLVAATVDIPKVPAPIDLNGPWTVTFPAGWGAPESAVFPKLISWPDSPDAGIRYFSGTATYKTTFKLDRSRSGQHLELDLGRVRNIAEVKLNGHSLGTLWKEPWRVDISEAVQSGENTLEIAITNLWPNRLIGDSMLPAEKRFTHSNVDKFKADSPLRESGLIGPVRILAAAVKPI
jgi:hypothetical protein